MKTPSDWFINTGKHIRGGYDGYAAMGLRAFSESDIADIQRDALKSALPIIEKVGTTGIEHAYPQAKAWLEKHFPEYL